MGTGIGQLVVVEAKLLEGGSQGRGARGVHATHRQIEFHHPWVQRRAHDLDLVGAEVHQAKITLGVRDQGRPLSPLILQHPSAQGKKLGRSRYGPEAGARSH